MGVEQRYRQTDKEETIIDPRTGTTFRGKMPDCVRHVVRQSRSGRKVSIVDKKWKETTGGTRWKDGRTTVSRRVDNEGYNPFRDLAPAEERDRAQQRLDLQFDCLGREQFEVMRDACLLDDGLEEIGRRRGFNTSRRVRLRLLSCGQHCFGARMYTRRSTNPIWNRTCMAVAGGGRRGR
jgi:hypothetical protein